MRAGIAAAGDGVGAAQEVEGGVEVAVRIAHDGPVQEALAVLAQEDVECHLAGVAVLALGGGADAGLRRRLVIGRVAQGIDAAPLVEAGGEAQHVVHALQRHGLAQLGLGLEPADHLRIRQLRQLLVDGRSQERMVPALQADHHPDGAAEHLRAHQRAVAAGGGGLVELGAPEAGLDVVLSHQEGDGTAGARGNLLHPGEVARRVDDVLAEQARRHYFHHAVAAGRHRLGEGVQLLERGEGAGHRLPVRCAVHNGSRGCEAEGAGVLGLPHHGGHGGDVLGGGVLVGHAPLAHDISAQGAMGDLAADIDSETTPVEEVEIFGEGLPAPADALGQSGARDILDPLHHLDEPVVPVRLHRCESDAAIA